MAYRKIRFGDFVRSISISQTQVNYNDLAPKPQVDSTGKEIPYTAPRVELRGLDIYRLLQPYVSQRFREQMKAVIPLATYLILFQLFILKQGIEDSWIIGIGLFAVMAGLMLFMEGLKLGLMPFGETIGNILPAKSPLGVVLIIAFLLGIGVTFAEPAIGALKAAGSIVDVEQAPYLYALLNEWSDTLVLMVGAGVGIASVLGTLRFIYGWSLKPMIFLSLAPTLGLTAYLMTQPQLKQILGLAWDCGAVTTGPVTVPLVLSLGIGVASAAGKGDSSMSGFGIVTLASVFPIIAVLSLALYLSLSLSPEKIIEAAQINNQNLSTQVSSLQQTPWIEMIGGIRAIIPLVLFLFFVLKVLLKEKLRHSGIIVYGITLAVIGMILFSIGLTYGLGKLGEQSGSLVPAAFANLPHVSDSPIYIYEIGVGIAFAFAWFLGFGSTLAEPALNALGMTVENLTNGVFKKSLLMYSVSFGVALGISLGVLKIIFSWNLSYMILPAYSLALLLTLISSEEYVNVAWDSAGVTTGPVTVPLVLAMGLGFGNAVQASDGFGILSMASICPILSVLISGLYIDAKIKKKNELENVTEEVQVSLG
ncbi:MAG: hypothetical protein CL678_14990 [Bdellovibrionaceae bacterium]|nr:hypothetical protein [Pseudobdellovibrionaceae bacterium]|tara:strand:+ start:616 stop:2391 length:1776 start_codon:yes stop_codon:yes gene_type:complete